MLLGSSTGDLALTSGDAANSPIGGAGNAEKESCVSRSTVTTNNTKMGLDILARFTPALSSLKKFINFLNNIPITLSKEMRIKNHNVGLPIRVRVCNNECVRVLHHDKRRYNMDVKSLILWNYSTKTG